MSRLLSILTDPRRRGLHAFVITMALVIHAAVHYATYVPALRGPLGSLPYFRLHPLHEAEFLVIIAYAGVVFGMRGGLVAIAVTALTSIPFILTPYIFGRQPLPNEIRDELTQVGMILALGYLLVTLYQVAERRRRADHELAVLRESQVLKDKFLSLASHELRTPLASIHGFSDLLLSRSPTEEQRREWLQRIHIQSGRLAKLSDELLDVSRIQAGRLEVAAEEVDLRQAVEESMEWDRMGVAKDRIVIDIPETLPTLSADRGRLTQVIANLLENAVKYSPNGGEIRVSAAVTAPGRVTISVNDHGVGIEKDAQDTLFAPFQRVQTGETVGIPGSGLGLYIVRSFVDAMGGTVNVESEPGKGSSFSFSLPVFKGQGVNRGRGQEQAAPSLVGA